jgi:hypothetical protein
VFTVAAWAASVVAHMLETERWSVSWYGMAWLATHSLVGPCPVVKWPGAGEPMCKCFLLVAAMAAQHRCLVGYQHWNARTIPAQRARLVLGLFGTDFFFF